jgi:hypothetical protein
MRYTSNANKHGLCFFFFGVLLCFTSLSSAFAPASYEERTYSDFRSDNNNYDVVNTSTFYFQENSFLIFKKII